jgi:formate/nitrite transporter FocA (FNT family)
MPTARGNELALIFVVSYVIALGDFTHVVAGSGEAFLLAFTGETGWANAMFGIVLPALGGNIFGGTVLFATLAYVQVMEEISEDRQQPQPSETLPPEPRRAERGRR